MKIERGRTRKLQGIGFVLRIRAHVMTFPDIRCNSVHSGAFGFVLRIRRSGCTRLHGVAPGCTGLHPVARLRLSEHALPLAASRIDAGWSATPQAARHAKNSAPSTTPQSCAIWTTIAHDCARFPRKTHEKIPDSC